MSHGVLDDIEKCMDSGWSDGLPVIPPYGSLVDPMLEAMGWQAQDVVGEIAEQSIKVRAEQVAAAAVMAGCMSCWPAKGMASSKLWADPGLCKR